MLVILNGRNSIVFPGAGTLFSQLSRFQIITVFISVMLLRIVVGYHFFTEGTAKLQSDSKFTSKYFLAGAKGPFAHLFKDMLEDADSSQRLCVVKESKDGGEVTFKIDHSLTILLWNDFLNKATEVYDLGSQEWQDELAKKYEKLGEQIREARAAKSSSVDPAVLELERKSIKNKIAKLQTQRRDGEAILKKHTDELIDWLTVNEVELVGHFASAGRLDGFERDGENRADASLYVDSLRGQVDTIRIDRNKDVSKWTSQVNAIWDSYEQQIQGLAIEEQVSAKGAITAHRPFDEPYSFSRIVDKVIPWFDTIIGISLILGLFTRCSSLAAGLFLLSVVMSQPPWIPDADPKVIFYMIEMFACAVLFATGAGRFGGLDFFLSPSVYRSHDEVAAAAESNATATVANTTQSPEGQPA